MEHLDDADFFSSVTMNTHGIATPPVSSSVHWLRERKENRRLLLVDSFGIWYGMLKGSVPVTSVFVNAQGIESRKRFNRLGTSVHPCRPRAEVRNVTVLGSLLGI